MINIQLLVWGSQNVGGPSSDLRMDVNPQETWLEMAKNHARQVAANHVRADGTTYHIVEYHPNTGERPVGWLVEEALLTVFMCWATEHVISLIIYPLQTPSQK